MMKTGVFRSQLLGSTIFSKLVFSFNSMALASIKADPAFLPNLVQAKLPAMPSYSNGNLADNGVGVLQIASACCNRHLLGKDKEYPSLIE
jgi:hypothetical protein